MRRKFLIFLLLPFFIFSKDIRKAKFAGSFYPGKKSSLSKMIDKFFSQIPEIEIDGDIFGIIVPHAGYIYSGKTASYAFKAIKGKKYSTVIIIGKSHHAVFKGAIIDKRDFWETPLGKVRIDKKIFNKLSKDKNFHSKKIIAYTIGGLGNVDVKKILDIEHSIEVEVPFLQKSLKNFKIFPVLTGDGSEENVKKIADSLYKVIEGRKDILIVASTDLSHYHPLNIAEKKDKLLLKLIEEKKFSLLRKKYKDKEVEMCGDAPVFILIEIAKKFSPFNVKVLNYSTSCNYSGNKEKVVGYGAVVFFKKERKMLTRQQKKLLLEIARKTLEEYLSGKKLSPLKIDDPVLKEKRGVFVTLKKHGNLRGCIGYIMPVLPLFEAVRKMAIESATNDPRFPPVTFEELKDIEIEISVLTVPKQVKSADEIVLGRDGVIVERGFHKGVFLPQVATETGWSKEEFLSNLCAHKAGLPPDAWKDPETKLYTFQAEVFSESEF